MNQQYTCGVDIGGSHITAALVDISTGKVNADTYTRSHVDAGGTIAAIIAVWSAVIKPLLTHPLNKSGKVGIAMPGPFEYEAGIARMKGQGKYDALYGADIRQLLSQALGLAPDDILFKNDAVAFIMGESLSGASQGFERVLGLTLGTGLGTTWHTPETTIDADLWNTPFEDRIAEEYISTRWFTGRYYELAGEQIQGVKELAGLVDEVPLVKEMFRAFGTRLGIFLADIVNRLYPAEVIVLGGNIANAMPLFMDDVTRELAARGVYIPVKKAVLGEEAALIGAVLNP